MFDHICAAGRLVLLSKTLLLMVVAFRPFATSLLRDQRRSRVRFPSPTGSQLRLRTRACFGRGPLVSPRARDRCIPAMVRESGQLGVGVGAEAVLLRGAKHSDP
jgi:hypothetical protein